MADTTEARSTPAQASVFATVELLELVLLNLDPITLFSIQRVCKQWKYLIADSHRLQERMFLRAPVCNNKPKTEIQPSTSCPTTTILPNHSAWDHYKHDNFKYNDTNENENTTPRMSTPHLSSFPQSCNPIHSHSPPGTNSQ
jgi:hypothetical protein